MSQNRVVYQCVALVGTNKVGQLQRDDKGYYEVVLGALNAYNSSGAYYPLAEARQLFEGSAELMRRITNGRLRGECGHPRYQEGMSERAWFARVNDLYEPNLCVHFSRVDLSYDTARDEQGRPLTLVIGRAKPSGNNSAWLEKQFENPEEDVCFSVRSFTEDAVQGGRLIKKLRKIVTWDTVNEPGISSACKYRTPSLESVSAVLDVPVQQQLVEADLEYAFSLESLRQSAEQEAARAVAVGMESAGAATTLQMVAELERPIKIFVPASFRW